MMMGHDTRPTVPTTRQSVKTRQQNEKRGRRAERWAYLYLTLSGYQILAIRYKTPYGEADLIAKPRWGRDKNIVAIIEVKYRQTLQLAHDSLQTSTIRRIEEAGAYFIQKHQYYQNCAVRYDAVFVLPWSISGPISGPISGTVLGRIFGRGFGVKLFHIKDAWRRS